MFDYTPEEFEELKERWLERAKRPTFVTNAEPAFDYSALERGEIPSFDRNNWNDPALNDLRAILYELDVEDVLKYEDLTLMVIYFADERRYLFIDHVQEEMFVLSQYKSRGRVQAFYNSEYGQPIRLDERDEILKKMTKLPKLGKYMNHLEDVKLTVDYQKGKIMLSFKNVRLNVNNFYQYLKDNLKEIEEGVISDNENRIRSITGLHKIANRIVITAEQAYENSEDVKEIEILSIDCDSAYLDFQIFGRDAKLIDKYLSMSVKDLLENDVFDTDDLVYAVSGDVSTQPWSAEFVLFGVFLDLDKAFDVANNHRSSINAFYLNKETSIYIGGYME